MAIVNQNDNYTNDSYIIELVIKTIRKAFNSSKVQQLPEKLCEYHELQVLLEDIIKINQFASALAKGDLSQRLETTGWLAGYLKAIQANNCHLNWQAQMVAQGDFTQRVDYMGDFSDSFNHMVASLDEKDKNLRASQESLQQIIEAIPAVVSIFRWSDKTLLYVSQKIREVFRLTPEEAIGRTTEFLWLDREERKRYFNILEKYGYIQDFECQFIRRNGDVFWALNNATMIEYQGVKAILSTSYDIQARKEIELELKSLATIDTLTGAANRRFFFDLAKQEFKRVQRHKNSVAFLSLDIDHFKRVNDNYSHQGGDEVLKFFVQACKKELRDVDLFGRIGGEEFAILLPETDKQAAGLVAERIRQKIERMVIHFAEHAIKITVSIGISMIDMNDKSLEQVVQRADRALYEAKNSGRNRVIG